MHKSYNELEQRYKKYYIKLFIKYFIVIAVLAAVVISLFSYGSSKQEQSIGQDRAKIQPKQDISKEMNLSKAAVDTDKTKKQPVTKKTKEQNKTSLERKRVVLEPQYSFDLKALLKQIPQPQDKNNIPQPKKTKDTKVPQEEISTEKKDLSSVLKIEHNSADTIQKKIAIFHQRPHVDKAYKVAKEYFEQKEYDKAIIWLKKADALEPAEEKVFELYAQTLYKQNKIEQASNLLNYFLNIKDSQKLQKLKEQIEKKSL